MPTYRMESIRVLGYEAPFTKINAEYVATLTITEKLQKGATVEQIFLEHNQGSGTKCRKGMNKYNIAFDSCQYVNKAMAIYNNLYEK